MNIKNSLSFLFLFTASIAGAQCNECFSDKSLEELKSTYEVHMRDVKKTPEYKRCEMAKEKHSRAHFLFGEAHVRCKLFRKNSPINWFIGGSQKDCDSIEKYSEEYWESVELIDLTKKELRKVMTSELKDLRDCILIRECDEPGDAEENE